MALRRSGLCQIAGGLDGLAQGFMMREQVSGAIAAVVSGEEVELRGYRVAHLDDQTPVSPDNMRFDISSITSILMRVAVMLLLEEGCLDLHADVSGRLRRLEAPGSEPLKHVSGGDGKPIGGKNGEIGRRPKP